MKREATNKATGREAPRTTAEREAPRTATEREAPRTTAGREAPRTTTGREAPRTTTEREAPRTGFFISSWKLSVAFRLAIVAAAACGVTLNLVMMGGDLAKGLSYYTLQSNIIALIFFAILAGRTLRRRSPELTAAGRTVKGMVTLCVFLTFLIFHFVLRPTLFTMGGDIGLYTLSPANILVHYVTPLLSVADWLLFDRKGKFRKFDPLAWTAIPWAYLAFAMIRARFAVFSAGGSRYPYFFIDVDQLGPGQVFLNVMLIAVGYVALGYVIYFCDRGLAKLGAGHAGRNRSSFMV
jgi:hypothetical protein